MVGLKWTTFYIALNTLVVEDHLLYNWYTHIHTSGKTIQLAIGYITLENMTSCLPVEYIARCYLASFEHCGSAATQVIV